MRTDSALHWILYSVKGAEPDREEFQKTLKTVAPELAQMTAQNQTKVVFKLLDNLQVRSFFLFFFFFTRFVLLSIKQ